ncbi:acetyl-CoA synthetase-like protein [Phellopilus nigrolimitatus]|nr:acetyl-CoA synthetase-like protein [Phellopilus nigrolimitatus]
MCAGCQGFRPTPASIPPEHCNVRMKLPEGASLPVHLHPLDPLAFLLRGATIYPHKLALAHPDVEKPVYYTYSVWAQRIQNLAYALIWSGIKSGDRIAILAPNTYDFAPMLILVPPTEALHGVLAARAVVTPINTRLTKGEIEFILDHSGSKMILVDHEYAHLVKDAKVPVIISKDTGRFGCPYEEFLSKGRQHSNERGWAGLEMELNEDAAATLCYTSALFALPKHCVICTLRGTYLAAIGNAYESRMTPDSVYFWILPMFHAAGWTFPWAITFSFAAQITQRTVSNPQIWWHFLNSGVTHYCGAPTVQIGIVTHPDARTLQRPITAVIAGSAPTAHLIGELEKKNIHVVHVYGLTYTYGPFTRGYAQNFWKDISLEARAKFIARQGHAFATAQEARVVYQDGSNELTDVPADGKTVGEIVTRGNIVMKEYFRDPEATKKAFRGGYFGSGDLAVLHEDGSIAIQDRSKDIIISGGENASSLAIEQELAEYHAVLEVAVVARPHLKWGERPMAFVILTPAAEKEYAGRHEAFEADLKKFARTRLPGFACPEWVRVVDDLPKTSTGKIMKTSLRGIVAKL